MKKCPLKNDFEERPFPRLRPLFDYNSDKSNFSSNSNSSINSGKYLRIDSPNTASNNSLFFKRNYFYNNK